MRGKAVAYALGKMMQLMSIVLCVPCGIAVSDLSEYSVGAALHNPETTGFATAIIICLVAGTIVAYIGKSERENQGIREGYAIVAFAWIIFAVIGSVPFLFYFVANDTHVTVASIFLNFTDGVFEVMSGFTTTGATILTAIESMPDSLLFWRSLTHWLGGMGIITLALAIFPAMGVSGYQMFRGEIPGPTADKLRPRLAQTAAILWGVYALLSLIETLLLMFGGMSLFDSLCHTFGTMATGGFSTRNLSIGAYNSPYFEWVIIVFMYLAGVNFLLHFNVLRGKWRQAIINREFLLYTAVIIAGSIFVSFMLYGGNTKSVDVAYQHYRFEKMPEASFDEYVAAERDKLDNMHDCIRSGTFQVVSITTTTGFGTADFDLWPDAIRYLLLVLMFFGGCAGSTGGGIKQIRILVLVKAGWRELRRLTRPRLIAPLRVGGVALEDEKISNIAAFFILFMMLFVLGSLLMTLFVPDLITAISATAACINNIGPGLAGVGSVEHYGWIPLPGKWILIACMLLGRLEIFTVMIVFRPSFWK